MARFSQAALSKDEKGRLRLASPRRLEKDGMMMTTEKPAREASRDGRLRGDPRQSFVYISF
jgi:hypothetical protein